MKKYFTLFTLLLLVGCVETQSAESTTGVKKATAEVKTQASGFTIEQENVKKRIEAENAPGAIKHLYVISAMSGDCIIYSTVKGKVTSSGKRLTPYSVLNRGEYSDGFRFKIGGDTKKTGEVMQDDGTYGHSIPYLYWWDTKGIYHQHYVAGGQIIHVAEKPISFPKIIVNLSR